MEWVRIFTVVSQTIFFFFIKKHFYVGAYKCHWTSLWYGYEVMSVDMAFKITTDWEAFDKWFIKDFPPLLIDWMFVLPFFWAWVLSLIKFKKYNSTKLLVERCKSSVAKNCNFQQWLQFLYFWQRGGKILSCIGVWRNEAKS